MRAGRSGEDQDASELPLDLGPDVLAEKAGQEAVVVLAEHDHVGAGVPSRVDDGTSGLTGSPHEVRPETRTLDPLARLREQPDQLRRRRDRLPLPVGDVVERAEVPVDLGIERHLEDREDDEAAVPRPRLLDAELERAAGGRRFVEADENSAHGPSLRGEPCRDLAEERDHPDVLVHEVLEHRTLDANGFVVA